MKKLLAILLCAVMLLSACALAEGRQITVKNVALTSNGTVALDLSALEAVIDVAAEGEAAGARLDITANGSSLGSVVAALVGQEALLQINAMTSSAYALDVSGLDLSSVTSSVENVMAEDNGAAFDAVLAQLDGIVTDGGVTTLNGMDYQTTLISISEEQMAALIAAAAEQNASVAEQMDGMSVSLSGAYYDAEGSDIVDASMSFDYDGEQMEVGVYAEYTKGEAGNDLLSLNLTVTADGESFGLNFDVVIANGDSAWLPTSIGDAVLLSVDEAAAEDGPVMTDLQNLAQSVLLGAMTAISGQLTAE